MKELEGKIAIVTGVGRAEGIGTEVCRELALRGADIFYTYWQEYDVLNFPKTKEYKPESFAKELEHLNVRVVCAEMDLSKPDAPHNLFKKVREKLGTPDILINNACYDIGVPFTELTAQVLDNHYFVNLRATALLCSEFVKTWRKEKGGRIINMTSGQSLGPMNVDQIPYTVTKAGLEMLAQQLAPGIAELGITINAVDPGPTDTGWMSEDLKKQLEEQLFVNQPDDVARAIVLLILKETENTTGQVIHVGR